MFEHSIQWLNIVKAGGMLWGWVTLEGPYWIGWCMEEARSGCSVTFKRKKILVVYSHIVIC